MATVASVSAAPTHAETGVTQNRVPQRIVSINACADQLLLALADRSQIAAVSQYVNDPTMSYYRRRATGLKVISGSAEEVLKLQPDLVLAGTFTRRATRQRLAQFGIPLATLKPVRGLGDVRQLIAHVGGLIGRQRQAAMAIANIDRMLETVSAASQGLRVLQFQRRGFVAGSATLMSDLLDRLGARNVAEDLGINSVRRASLETVVKARPDALVLFRHEGASHPHDQGAAMLSHPALRRVVPDERRILIPMNQVICGGPQVVAALQTLSAALSKLTPRRP